MNVPCSITTIHSHGDDPVWVVLTAIAALTSLVAMVPIGISWGLSSFHYEAGMVGNDYGEIEVWDSVWTSGVNVGRFMLPYWIVMLACAAAAIASIVGLVRSTGAADSAGSGFVMMGIIRDATAAVTMPSMPDQKPLRDPGPTQRVSLGPR